MPDINSDNSPVKKVVPQIDIEPDEIDDDEPDDGTEDETKGSSGFLDTLRGGASSAKGMFKNGFSGLTGAWFGAKPIAKAVSNGVGKGADYFNIPKKTMGAILAVTTTAAAAGGGISVANYYNQTLLLKNEAYIDDCFIDVNKAKGQSVDAIGGDNDARQREIAEKLWAFGKAAGMTDYQCAGMLGNFNQESGLDPTAIELVTDGISVPGSKPVVRYVQKVEEYNGTKQSEYVTSDGLYDGQNGTQRMDMSLLVSKYSISINVPAYADGAGHNCWGVGLLQWTGPTGKDLMDFANGCHASHPDLYWFSLEVQMADMLRGGQMVRFNGFLNDTTNANSVENATASWLGYMERGAGHAVYSGFQYDKRLNFAKHWYTLLSPSSAAIASQYASIYDTIIALAGTAASDASAAHAHTLDKDCDSEKKDNSQYDNSGIAKAAVAYAWETKDMGRGNNGTALYKAVKDSIYPGDGIYQSCDRGAATAIKWSGADVNFPVGNTDTQWDYCLSHPEIWEDVTGAPNRLNNFDGPLEPGDVLLCPNGSRQGTAHGHILLYVGEEAVKEKYPDSDALTVSASYNERSPGCGDAGDPIAIYRASMGGGNAYKVFRFIGEYNTEYQQTSYNGSASGTSQ